MSGRQLVPRLLVLAGIAAAILWAVLNREHLDPQALDDWLAALGPWAPAAYIAAFVLAAMAFVPGSLFALAGGAMFGPVWGPVLNITGAVVGATAAFLAARYLAGDWVARRAGDRLKRVMRGVEAEGWRFVALLRMVPVLPFSLVNYILGLTRIGLVTYIVTSTICMVPGAIAFTWLGHAGREALTGGGSALGYGLAALGLLVALALLAGILRRLRRRH